MTNPQSISFYDTTAIEALRKELRIDPHALRRVRTAWCKRFLGREAALGELPAPVRDEFARRVRMGSLRLEVRRDSQHDGASKLVFLTSAARRIESVLLRADTGRIALCISSQVGCAANCDFCATGKMGFAANLTADEMLDQIVLAGEQLAPEGRKVRNIVLMGMGEPFHNEHALYAAVDTLLAPAYFHHPPTRLLVSTVGIPDAMRRFARRYPEVNLALSLHAVRQEVREAIIPLAKKYDLHELRRTLGALQTYSPRSAMIEYLLLEGVNDSLDDARLLAQWVHGLKVHINLIPFNRVEGAPHLVGTARPQREAFARVLKDAGLPTTLRYSMGADIDAACGQLVQQMERRRRSLPSDVPS